MGKLPDARYEALDAQYAKEQDALNAEITELEKAVTGYEQSRKSAEKFIALIDKYENHFIIQAMSHGFRKKILLLMVKLESSISTVILTSRNYTMSQMVFILLMVVLPM